MGRPWSNREKYQHPLEHLFTFNAQQARAQEPPPFIDVQGLFPMIASIEGGRGGGSEGGNGAPPGWWRDGPFEPLNAPRPKFRRAQFDAQDSFDVGRKAAGKVR